MTRARDVADTQDNIGGAVAPFVAGKNKIINGDFGIWQRGTTLNLPGGVGSYLADRFNIRVDGAAGTPVYSRQTFTPGTAPIAGYEGQFFARFTTGGNLACSINQSIEDVRTFAGQTVTVSFWMKTSAAKTFTMLLRQDFGSGGSSIVDLTASYTTTTSWQRFTQTFTLASIAGKTIGTNSSLLLQPIAYGSQTGNFDVDIWGVQVEAGSVATPFTTASGSIGGELALCQRYFEIQDWQISRPYITVVWAATAVAVCNLTWKVTKRANPSISWTGNGGLRFIYPGGTPSGITINAGQITVDGAGGFTTQTFTVTGAGWLDNGGTMQISAEL
jgi:hypothetical protein